MKRLLIDASHILKACLHSAGTGPHARKVGEEILPGAEDGYENWLGSLSKTLKTLGMVPSQVIFVKDGYASKDLRRQFLPTYKERPAGVEGWHDEFVKMQTMAEENLLSYGAISVEKEKWEADDIIAALAEKLDCIIWSGDKDLLAAGDVFYQGEINPDKFLGIQKRHIVVYKSLVGDTSDKIPGCNGFGESAFVKMLTQFGDDSLDDMLDMLENRTLQELAPYTDFKPFQKILDNEEQVYASYQCAKFHHPGWELNWQARYPKGDGTWPEWDLKIELITKAKLTAAMLNTLGKELKETPMGPSLDIETWSDEESLAWGIANKTARGPRLDVYGAHMAGFSVTGGPNNNKAYYFPVDHAETENISLDDMRDVLNLLSDSQPTYVWNEEFELPVIRNHMELRFDRGWLPNVHDGLIMKSYVNENTPLGLKFSSKEYLGYTQVTFEEVTAVPVGGSEEEAEEGETALTSEEVVDDYEAPPSRQMNLLTGQETVLYGADDSICTGALVNLFDVIMRYEGTYRAFDMCEIESAYLCAEAFLTGQRFDFNRLDELTIENAKKSAEMRLKINEKLIDLEWEVGDPLSGASYMERMPGCKFEPAHSLAASELKKVYLQIVGEPLKSNIRSVDKLAQLMYAKAPALTAALTLDEADFEVEDTGDLQLTRFNAVAERMFVPSPQLNLGSPKQVCALLYDALKFPVRLRGRLTDKMRAKGITSGNRKGNESAIRHAIMYKDATPEQAELLLMLIDAKALQTDSSLYLKPYVKMPNPKDGMVHGSYGQSRQKTRRFSSSAPNRTQLSHKSPIREVYVPMFEDHVIVSFDEASQELRHAAYHSQDAAMLSCFIGDNKKDIHSITGRAIMEKQGKLLTYEEFMSRLAEADKEIIKARKSAKPANFLDQYGGTAPTLAEQILVAVEEAQKIMDAKHEAFPDAKIWQDKVIETCRELKYALTPLGARKHMVLDGTWKDNHELRSGLNSIIQGGAAEQIKRAMVKLWLKRITDTFDCVFLFPCHDELVFSCHIDHVVDFCREVHAVMIEPFADMEMPWESSIEIGWNYGKMKEFGSFDAEAITTYIGELKCQKDQ